MRFEKLEEESALVRDKKICRAGSERDQGTFKQQDYVAYCPDCQTPFHAECWLALEQCPVCQYDVAGLIRRVLDPSISAEAALQEMSVWANP
jgi:Zn finger protein HypA/HybF involved in hydrogenase expression